MRGSRLARAIEWTLVPVSWRPRSMKTRRVGLVRSPACNSIQWSLDLRQVHHFAAGAGGQRREQARTDGVRNESDTAVAERKIGAARMRTPEMIRIAIIVDVAFTKAVRIRARRSGRTVRIRKNGCGVGGHAHIP